jgi:heme exporter protein B
MSALAAFGGLLERDLRLSLRHRSDIVMPILFYVIVVCLFPLGTRPEPGLLARYAPAILWVAALLSTLLAMERLFRSDFEDGSLEQLLLSPYPTAWLVLAKVLAHWLSTGLFLVLISPVLALILGLPIKVVPVLLLSLLLGTPILSLMGAIGTALTVGLPRGGMLLALLILPLYTPVLIFGANGVAAAVEGLPVQGPMLLLAAMLVLAITLAPFAIAAALRVSVE